jgi:hypothetical protein
MEVAATPETYLDLPGIDLLVATVGGSSRGFEELGGGGKCDGQ